MEFSVQRSFTTKIEFLKKLPSADRLGESLVFRPGRTLVIYDKRLNKNEGFTKWLAEFPLHYSVTGGEELKELADFSFYVRKISGLLGSYSPKSLAIVAVGGGSVGDFAGFLASVLKRGVALVHIPTTFLAAMDSAHGGKTALNTGGVKNQVGTFYPASCVLLIKSVFETLPDLQLRSAAGELAKMALISGGSLFERFSTEFKLEFEKIWELLPEVIEAKYRVVLRDPFEESGERQILNLGHTLGHVLESYYGLPHGIAVGEGLMFAVQWSQHQGYFRKIAASSGVAAGALHGDGNGRTEATPAEVERLLVSRAGILPPRDFVKEHRAMSRSKLSRYLSEDKKLTDARSLSFIFIEGVGRPFRKTVPIESFLVETQRQGWTFV